MMEDNFKQYIVQSEKIPALMGIRFEYLFPNGYGASVIRHRGSYGFESGLFEIAALIDGQFAECIGKEVTYPIGHLTWEQVQEELKRIAEEE